MAIFLLAFAGLGAALAIFADAASWPVGTLGAVAFTIWAIWQRRRWRRDTDDRAPAAPERVVRICAAGTALVLGHSVVLHALPDLDLRTDHGHILVLDSWTLAAAWLVGWLFFLSEARVRDERHTQIVAGALRTGYAALHILLIPFCLYIAFAPREFAPEPFDIANTLITIMLAAYLALLVSQLRAYSQDALTTDDWEADP